MNFDAAIYSLLLLLATGFLFIPKRRNPEIGLCSIGILLLAISIISGTVGFRIASNVENKRYSLERMKIAKCLDELQALIATDPEEAYVAVRTFNDTFTLSTYKEALEKFFDCLEQQPIRSSTETHE
jgi:hypothetical protein